MDYNSESYYQQDFSAEQDLLNSVRSCLSDPDSSLTVPDKLNFSFNPDISNVYITLFQKGRRHIRWGSRRKTLKASLERVIQKLQSNKNFQDFSINNPDKCRLLFEIVIDEYPCEPKQLTTIQLNENRLEPGIHGLKFTFNGQLFYYMPTDAVTNSLMTVKQVFNFLSKRTGLAKLTDRISVRAQMMRSEIQDCKLVRSIAFISYGNDLIPLYRGYPVPVELNKDVLRDCITKGSDWILENMKPNGQFLYYYDAVKDSEVDFQHPRMTDPTYYNILRHSGGTITLLRAFELTGNSKYLDGARKSIEFFLTVFREHEYLGNYACYPFFNKKSKLGGAGIGLVSIIHYFRLSGDNQFQKYIDGLVYHILSRVSETGELIGYFIHPSFYNGQEIHDPDEETKKQLFSFYYPGEALLGLVLYLHHIPAIDPELSEQIKEKSKLALDFLIHERPKKYDYMFEPLPSDGWLMQAIEEWVKIEGFDDQSYIDFVFNDAQAMIDNMYQEHNSPYFDYTGSFYYQYGEHAYPDGARCEGLVAAYYLARDLGDEHRASHFMKYLVKSAKNLLYTYNTPESCYAHKKPEKSINSFRFKLTRQWVRVDSVQHTACFYARLLPEVTDDLIDKSLHETNKESNRQDADNRVKKTETKELEAIEEDSTLPDSTNGFSLKSLEQYASYQDIYSSIDSQQEVEGFLLYNILQKIDAYFAAQNFSIINQKVEGGRIYDPTLCREWTRTSSGKNKPQFFGTYCDFGSRKYLLNVRLGTTNIHIGFVKYRQTNNRYFIQPLDRFDELYLINRYGANLPNGIDLVPRKWGGGWITIDCGSIYTFSEDGNYTTCVDFDNSPLLLEYIQPLCDVLKSAQDLSKLWIWKKFDKRQLWRFFVDGRFHKKYRGWVGYEANELNSTRGMLNGFSFIFKNFDLGGHLTEKYILDLHRACMSGVRAKNKKSTPGEYRFQEAGFLFYEKNSTINSLCEIFKARRGDNTHLFQTKGYDKTTEQMSVLELYQGLQEKGNIRYRPWYPNLDEQSKNIIKARKPVEEFHKLQDGIRKEYRVRVRNILDSYNKNILDANCDYDKLYAIAKVVRDLEVLHPFPDGNGRAFPVLLMNHLLTYHNFPPVIHFDPNIDAELSCAEFVVETVKGMKNTMTLLTDPRASAFKYSIDDLTDKENDAFLHMANQTIELIDRFDAEPAIDEDAIYLTPEHLQRITEGKWTNLYTTTTFNYAGHYNTYRKDSVYFANSLKDWIKEKKDIPAEFNKVLQRAKALVMDNQKYAKQVNAPVLMVDDVDAAFKKVAASVRKEVGPKTVLVTGTEGKTGTKVQLYHLLKHQTNVHAVLNSANTEGPILRSLANLKADDKVEITEVSVGPHEDVRVERARIVSPDICFFTNIGPNHMDMHKTLENIILAKSSVVEGLPPGGVCILNSKNEYYQDLRDSITQRRNDLTLYTYGVRNTDNARLVSSEFSHNHLGWKVVTEIEGEQIHYHVPLIPEHVPLMSAGILLAVKMLGYDFKQAAQDYLEVKPFETMGRVIEIHKNGGNVLFYDQSRRGAIQGMRSAFQDLKNFHCRGKIVALTGGISINKDNDWTRESHGELAQLINESSIKRLYTTGNFMHYVHEKLDNKDLLVKHEDDLDQLAQDLFDEVEDGDILFIIGSAYLYLGRVADRILKKAKYSIVT